MRENNIEKQLRKQAKPLKILVMKFTSPGETGVPDDIVIHLDGRLHFVELKTAVGKLKPKQIWWLDRLTAWGQTCFVIYGMDDLTAYLEGTLKPWNFDHHKQKLLS